MLFQSLVFGLVAILAVAAIEPLVVAQLDKNGSIDVPDRQASVATGPTRKAEARKPADSLRFSHASLAAYENAVISLKAPKSGMTFYVESNGRRLVALDRDGALAWGVDVLDQVQLHDLIGKPVIRHLELNPDGSRLWVTFGKHDFAEIDIQTGELGDRRQR